MPTDFSQTVELLTISEVAEILRISKTGVRRLQHGRQLPFHKVGTHVRFSKDDVVTFLAKHRVEAIGS